MNPYSSRDRLLEDALMPGSLVESLAAVRRATRRRRLRVRVIRTAAAVGVVLGATWVFRFIPSPASRSMTESGVREAPPPFVLVTNRTQQPSPVVRTLAAPSSLIVTTRTPPVTIMRASREELFASAGERPGGLVQLADGSARWMWLDVPEFR